MIINDYVNGVERVAHCPSCVKEQIHLDKFF